MIILQMTTEELESLLIKVLLQKITPAKEMGTVLYTRAEVAKKFNVSLATLHVWIKNGFIPHPIKKGRRVFFHEKDIEDCIARTLSPNSH